MVEGVLGGASELDARPSAGDGCSGRAISVGVPSDGVVPERGEDDLLALLAQGKQLAVHY